MKKLIFLISFFFSVVIWGQTDNVTITGDSLKGKVIDGQRVREVIGNVIITQDDVKITCRKAIQYFTENKIELIGDVVVTQDTFTLKTDKGFYLSESKLAYTDTAVTMNDGHINLDADKGDYYTELKKGIFRGNVNVVDTSGTLNADVLELYQQEDKLIATGNVALNDSSGTIYSDSLIALRKEDKTIAIGQVKVESNSDNVTILGEKLTDDKTLKYTRIEGNPMMMRIDTTNSGRTDTLLISSRIMESYDDSLKRLITIDSVKIIRGDFAALNSKSILYRTDNTIKTFKQEEDKNPPVMWFETSQLTGDSINIYIENKLLNMIEINDNAFVLTRNENYPFRYDQISGDSLRMHFLDSKLNFTEVYGNVLSIYYMYDKGEPSGLLKSSSKDMKVYFDSSRVADVRMYEMPRSEYHPENLVENNERAFTLPSFVLYYNRPDKYKMLQLFNQRINPPVNK